MPQVQALRNVASAPSLVAQTVRRHPASLMPITSHSPALVDLMRSPISERMVGKWKISCLIKIF